MHPVLKYEALGLRCSESGTLYTVWESHSVCDIYYLQSRYLLETSEEISRSLVYDL